MGRMIKRASFGMIDLDFDPEFTPAPIDTSGAAEVKKKAPSRKEMIRAANVIQKNWKGDLPRRLRRPARRRLPLTRLPPPRV